LELEYIVLVFLIYLGAVIRIDFLNWGLIVIYALVIVFDFSIHLVVRAHRVL